VGPGWDLDGTRVGPGLDGTWAGHGLDETRVGLGWDLCGTSVGPAWDLNRTWIELGWNFVFLFQGKNKKIATALVSFSLDPVSGHFGMGPRWDLDGTCV